MEETMRKTGTIRKGLVILLGGALYAILYALGSQIDQVGATQLGTSLLRFAYAMPVAVIALYALFRYAMPRLEMKPDTAQKRPFCTVGAWALLFICYVPMFLIQYPGTFMYDTQAQMDHIVFNTYSTFHPLLHTLLLRACVDLLYHLGSMERCAALYSIVQMVLVSGCFALFCASLSRSVSRRVSRIALAFFCLYPMHMAFACNCTKDVLFSSFLALFVALSLESLRNTLTTGRRILLILSGVLACLLRNNMIYAMIVWCVVMLIGRKQRRMGFCALLMIVCAMLVNQGLVVLLDAEGGSVSEMLSVPSQQLARARLLEPQAFTQQEDELLDHYLMDDAYEGYEPTLADWVKSHINKDTFQEDPVGAAKLWLSVGMKCPGVYLDAFLNLTLPFLYPYTQYQVDAIFLETGIRGNNSLTRNHGLPDIVQPGRFEGARTWLKEEVFLDGADSHPILRWLFNTGLVFWLLLLCMLYDVYRGNWQRVLIMLLPLLLYGTYLLGPVMQARYAYPFICCLPLFVFRRKEVKA